MPDAIFYLVKVLFAESVTVFIDAIAGIVIYLFLLLFALIQAASKDGYYPNKLILVLTLVPLIRIISLSMPLVDIPQIWWYPVIYLPLALAVVVIMRIFQMRASEISFSWGRLPLQLAIGLLGIGLGYIEYLILKPEPIVSELTFQTALLPGFLLLITTGFVEELIFRGILQRPQRCFLVALELYT